LEEKRMEQHICPSCGQNAEWVKAYERWYCHNENKYI